MKKGRTLSGRHSAFTPEEFEQLTPLQQRWLAQREDLIRAALEALLVNGAKVKRDLESGGGIWHDSLAPLAPQERTLVLNEVRKLLGVPMA